MSSSDPYTPPSAPAGGPSPRSAGEGAVPPALIDLMDQTRPWVRLLGVLGFVFCGLMILAGIAFLAGAAGGMLPAPIGLIYILLSALYVAPSLFLWRYASSIVRLREDRSMDSLVVAIGHQKSFWRFAGMLMAILLVLYVAILVVVFAVGLGAAFFAK